MWSAFRSPSLLICCMTIIALVPASGQKSIIRKMLESPSQFAAANPDIAREKDQIENCRIRQNKELSGKLDRLCDECFQTYRVANFYVQCRAGCFDNRILRGCALAMFRQTLVNEFERYLDTEVAVHGVTVLPTELAKNGNGVETLKDLID